MPRAPGSIAASTLVYLSQNAVTGTTPIATTPRYQVAIGGREDAAGRSALNGTALGNRVSSATSATTKSSTDRDAPSMSGNTSLIPQQAPALNYLQLLQAAPGLQAHPQRETIIASYARLPGPMYQMPAQVSGGARLDDMKYGLGEHREQLPSKPHATEKKTSKHSVINFFKKRLLDLHSSDRKRNDAVPMTPEHERICEYLATLASDLCPKGYAWYPTSHDYRCYGGTHFISRALALDIVMAGPRPPGFWLGQMAQGREIQRNAWLMTAVGPLLGVGMR